MQEITISSPEWTTAEITASWTEEESAAVAAKCTDSMIAYLILHTHETLPGWSYTDGAFTGRIRLDAIDLIASLMMAATDYVIEHLDEIRADALADA